MSFITLINVLFLPIHEGIHVILDTSMLQLEQSYYSYNNIKYYNAFFTYPVLSKNYIFKNRNKTLETLMFKEISCEHVFNPVKTLK